MGNIFGYESKRVLVSGGGGAGMGAAAVRDLLELGAEVHVLDLKEPSSDVSGYHHVDLRDPAAVEAAVEAVGGRVDRLFNCAGLPGPPFSGLDTMLVNFVGARHLTSLVVDRLMPDGGAVATISSAAGFGWEHMLEATAGLIATPGFAEAKAWCEEHEQLVDQGYLLSKQVLMIWTLHAAMDYTPRGIRVNCIGPGPTDTPMMPAFESYMGKDFMDRFPKPLHGRNSTPDEQAHVLVFVNSNAASYLTGVNVFVDGGFDAGMITGRLDLSVLAGE